MPDAPVWASPDVGPLSGCLSDVLLLSGTLGLRAVWSDPPLDRACQQIVLVSDLRSIAVVLSASGIGKLDASGTDE